MSTADSKVIWIDGELVPYERAQVHILSHSLHYGSAAFEGIRAYKTTDGRTAIFKLAEHMERFVSSVAVLGGKVAYDIPRLVEAAAATVRANGFDECYVRPIAWIDESVRGLKLPAEPKFHTGIATWKWGKYLGTDSATKGIKVNVASFRRPDVASSNPWAKLSGNYLNSIYARREATLAGVDEAILLDQQGFVAEGSGENIFVVEKGVLHTPPADAILPGLTRAAVIDLAHAAGMTVKVERVTRNRLYAADELFFTGTAAEVTPISFVDGHAIGAGKPGPVTGKIAALFEDAIRGRHPEFKRWLHFV